MDIFFIDIRYPLAHPENMKKTLLTLPEDLLGNVQKISGAATKSGAVVTAMEEYVRDKKLNRLMGRIGKGFGISLKELKKSRKKG